MIKIRTLFLSLFVIISAIFFVTPVLAGGGPVYIDLGSTLSSWNNPDSPRQVVAKVHLHPDVPCIGTKITFKYEDQKDGDSVSTGSGGSAYVIRETGSRWLSGKSVYDCSTYAKYTSKNKELKYGVIIVSTPKGETYERKVALNFQSNDPIQSSGDNLPWDGPEKTGTSSPLPKTSSNPIASPVSSIQPVSKTEQIELKPTNSSETAQLQQKVDNLQKQLQESQQKQASLEKTLNNLISWIKSIFPFFK